MWHLVPDSSLPSPGRVRAVEVGGRRIALWCTDAGTVVACDARCPHQWADLGVDGVVDGEELVCSVHGWRFGVDGVGCKVAMNGRRDEKAPVAVHPVRLAPAGDRDRWEAGEHPDEWSDGDPGPAGAAPLGPRSGAASTDPPVLEVWLTP